MGRLFWFDRKDQVHSEKLIMANNNDKFIYQNEWRKYHAGKEWQAMYFYSLTPYFDENRIKY